MKFSTGMTDVIDRLSLPARGAWVEMDNLLKLKELADVAPRTGSVG